MVDHVRIDDGIVVESFDRHGEVVAESVAFETKQVSVASHVDRQAGTTSTRVARGTEWERRSKEAEEEAVGWAIAKVLEQETGIPWRVQPVPKEERHPDVRLTPSAPTPIAAHEVEVRHLDEAVIKGVNSNRGLNRRENLHAIGAMLENAVMAKHGHYDPAWLPRGTLALQVPTPVGAAFVQVLRDKSAILGDGFRELWLVADGTAHRLRPAKVEIVSTPDLEKG